MGTLTGVAGPLRLAIVGGGFTGVALAIHALGLSAAAAFRRCDRALGKTWTRRGLRNDKPRSSHQRAKRSDVACSVPIQLTSPAGCLKINGCRTLRALILSGASTSQEARLRPIWRHVLAQTARSATSASLRHRQTRVIGLARENEGFRLDLADGASLQVDRVAICTGHVPSAPCPCPRGAARHPRFIANPWASGSLATVRRSDSVLIVGTGLTMVDVVTTLASGRSSRLHRRRFRGVACCPAATARLWTAIDLFEGVRPATALELLRLVRAEVRSTRDDGLDWQAVIDALRRKLPEIWSALPASERIRAVRRLMRFLGRSPLSDCAAGRRRRRPPEPRKGR